MIPKIVLKASQEELYSIFRNYSDVGFFCRGEIFICSASMEIMLLILSLCSIKYLLKKLKYSEIQMFFFVRISMI